MRSLTALSVLLCLICTGAIYWGSYSYFKRQELETAAARLTLYRSSVEASLRHFGHLPFVLSLDPVVIETLAGGDRARLNKRLARIAQSAGIDVIYLMEGSGLTISASNAASPSSFVGQNYGFRPYFQNALRGELGEFYGIGATTGVPGYFYAMAVRNPAGPDGVVAIKLDLSGLQDSWQASGERIILSNADGVVLLASQPGWRYHTLAALTQAQRSRILSARQFADEPLRPLDWTPDLPSQTASIDGERYLYLHTRDLPNGWSLHFFAPDDAAVTRASLITGGILLLLGALLLLAQLRRVQLIRGALERSEQEEAQLRLANERLAVEIEERRTAEQRLQKTQTELERAGRLAALGRLASSVTHELGQPIAAMRNQLAAAELSAGVSPLAEKMAALVARMEDITRQLKFFSRKGRDQFEPVDLAKVVGAALELLAPNIERVGAKVSFEPPNAPLILQGNLLRLEQAITNLVRNALDAIEGAETRHVQITLGRDAETLWIDITDSGHGLGGQSLDELREPFATTRESGKGMGLGLTISAGIVADHEGELSAEEAAGGGARFRACFPQGEVT